jgi:hypothetical protein
MIKPLALMSDSELIQSLKSLVQEERGSLISVLKHLGEIDRRRLAVKAGFPSLFDYCLRELGYAEGEAVRRIKAARAAARFPVLFRCLESGRLSLTAVSLLAPHLKRENYARLIQEAAGRRTREVEALIASLVPGPRPMERIRYVGPISRARASAAAASGPVSLGDPFPAASSPSEPGYAWSAVPAMTPMIERPLARAPQSPGAEAHREPPPGETDAQEAQVAPPGAVCAGEPIHSEGITPPRVKFSFTASEAFLHEVERAKELLRHRCPTGSLEAVFGVALSCLLERIDPERRLRRKAKPRSVPEPRRSGEPGARKADGLSKDAAAWILPVPPGPQAASEAPPLLSSGGRGTVPGRVRDEVWRRDGGRCAFLAADGRRCSARAGLEIDHVVPLARGGSLGDPRNLRLLCRAHNGIEARRVFGDEAIDKAIARRRSPAAPGSAPASGESRPGWDRLRA